MINADVLTSRGSLHAVAIDTSDLASVMNASLEIQGMFSAVHFLVNNAGIHYISQPMVGDRAAQGFDVVFATNYLVSAMIFSRIVSIILSLSLRVTAPTFRVSCCRNIP